MRRLISSLLLTYAIARQADMALKMRTVTLDTRGTRLQLPSGFARILNSSVVGSADTKASFFTCYHQN